MYSLEDFHVFNHQVSRPCPNAVFYVRCKVNCVSQPRVFFIQPLEMSSNQIYDYCSKLCCCFTAMLVWPQNRRVFHVAHCQTPFCYPGIYDINAIAIVAFVQSSIVSSQFVRQDRIFLAETHVVGYILNTSIQNNLWAFPWWLPSWLHGNDVSDTWR